MPGDDSSRGSLTYPEAKRAPSVLVETSEQLLSLVGVPLEPSDWHVLTQRRIDEFAAVTSDFQWIHVDPEAARKGPFGSTVAHGYLTLSLIPLLLSEVVDFDRSRAVTMNYGIEKARFPAPLPVDSEFRAVGRVVQAVESNAGMKVRFAINVERREGDRPVLAADLLWIVRFPREEQP